MLEPILSALSPSSGKLRYCHDTTISRVHSCTHNHRITYWHIELRYIYPVTRYHPRKLRSQLLKSTWGCNLMHMLKVFVAPKESTHCVLCSVFKVRCYADLTTVCWFECE